MRRAGGAGYPGRFEECSSWCLVIKVEAGWLLRALSAVRKERGHLCRSSQMEVLGAGVVMVGRDWGGNAGQGGGRVPSLCSGARVRVSRVEDHKYGWAFSLWSLLHSQAREERERDFGFLPGVGRDVFSDQG